MVSCECVPFAAHLCRAFDDVFYWTVLLIHIKIGSGEMGYGMPQVPCDGQRF